MDTPANSLPLADIPVNKPRVAVILEHTPQLLHTEVLHNNPDKTPTSLVPHTSPSPELHISPSPSPELHTSPSSLTNLGPSNPTREPQQELNRMVPLLVMRPASLRRLCPGSEQWIRTTVATSMRPS